jgi:hypothetical protein
MIVQVRAGLGEERLVSGVGSLLDRHDVLRTRLRRSDGRPMPPLPVGAVPAILCLRHVDVSGAGPGEVAAAAREHLAAAAARLDPGAAVMIQLVWLDAGPVRSGRLLVVVHDHVAERVPWPVLLRDLVSGWKDAPPVPAHGSPAVGIPIERVVLRFPAPAGGPFVSSPLR